MYTYIHKHRCITVANNIKFFFQACAGHSFTFLFEVPVESFAIFKKLGCLFIVSYLNIMDTSSLLQISVTNISPQFMAFLFTFLMVFLN